MIIYFIWGKNQTVPDNLLGYADFSDMTQKEYKSVQKFYWIYQSCRLVIHLMIIDEKLEVVNFYSALFFIFYSYNWWYTVILLYNFVYWTLQRFYNLEALLAFNFNHIYIYIYCHPQTDCFVVSQLFHVARHVGRLKLGLKPAQLYIWLRIRPLGQQAYHLGKGIIRYYVASAASVCLHFIPYRIPEYSIRSKSFALCEQQPKIPSPDYSTSKEEYIYIYIYIYYDMKILFFFFSSLERS